VLIPYGRHDVDDADIAAVVAALRGSHLTCGPLVARFEAGLAAAVGAGYASACINGTAALHLAYAGLGIGAGDEIITTPLTFSATASAAYQVGATVRLADVDPITGAIDPADVERLITPRTRAIVPVHLGGTPVELEPIWRMAAARQLLVIEDACHALGASYRGTPIGGGRSDAVVFSFHPVKHITTGEGGAVCVRDPDVKHRIDRLRHHGIERDDLGVPSPGPWYYEVQEAGFNYRLPDIACALGLSQLDRLPAFVARRRALADRYRDRLLARFGAGPAAPVRAPIEPTGRTSSYHLFAAAIAFDRVGVSRAGVMTALAARGIGTQVHYVPLHHHPLHARRAGEHADRPRPGVDAYYATTLSLPMFPRMTDADVDVVVDALARALEMP
jgi:UDP-4-amino-4,6-dideoxy-N-acetyl-beta-L-altrosamine transaminase